MKDGLVWSLVLDWLFECYEPPYVAPPPDPEAQFDPTDYGRLQYDDLVRRLQPVRRPPPPLVFYGPAEQVRYMHEYTDEELAELVDG